MTLEPQPPKFKSSFKKKNPKILNLLIRFGSLVLPPSTQTNPGQYKNTILTVIPHKLHGTKFKGKGYHYF